MGTTVRLLAPAGAPLAAVRDGIEALAARLTRFHPATSELSALNADPAPGRPGLAAAAPRRRRRAPRRPAHRRPLPIPTLLGALEDAGYATSRVGVEPASLRDALRAAPPRRPARPARRWREVRVDHAAGTIARPPGLRLDLGGSAKGLAADWAARRLAPYGRFAVDCGGDVRLGGTHEVARARHARDASRVTDGAVATSGLDRRVWQRPDGAYAHHLLDPSTGEPAWTGLIAATALAPTALEAEALAKAALLSGPRAERGGCWPRAEGSSSTTPATSSGVGLRSARDGRVAAA